MIRELFYCDGLEEQDRHKIDYLKDRLDAGGFFEHSDYLRIRNMHRRNRPPKLTPIKLPPREDG